MAQLAASKGAAASTTTAERTACESVANGQSSSSFQPFKHLKIDLVKLYENFVSSDERTNSVRLSCCVQSLWYIPCGSARHHHAADSPLYVLSLCNCWHESSKTLLSSWAHVVLTLVKHWQLSSSNAPKYTPSLMNSMITLSMSSSSKADKRPEPNAFDKGERRHLKKDIPMLATKFP